MKLFTQKVPNAFPSSKEGSYCTRFIKQEIILWTLQCENIQCMQHILLFFVLTQC